MDKRVLKYLGAALYVCEGTKARRDYRSETRYIYSIEFTNSDPKIIRLFSKFLKSILNIDWARVRGQLFLYPDLNEHDLKLFWSKTSKIPLSQFQKSIILKAKTGKFKANPYGTFKMRYGSKEDFFKLQAMINDLWRDARVV